MDKIDCLVSGSRSLDQHWVAKSPALSFILGSLWMLRFQLQNLQGPQYVMSTCLDRQNA